jgi:hypothetical protein
MSASARGGQMGHLSRASRLLKGPVIFNYHLNTVRHIHILYRQIINLYYAYYQLFGKLYLNLAIVRITK